MNFIRFIITLLCFNLIQPVTVVTTSVVDDVCWGMSIEPVSNTLFQDFIWNDPSKTVVINDIIDYSKGKYSKQAVLNYLAQGLFLSRAYAASKETSIPTSVLIAQTILESDLGKSGLCKETGNQGNVKCRCSWDASLRESHARLRVCVRGYDKIEKSNDYYVIIPTDWQDWRKRIGILTRYRVVRSNMFKGLGWEEWTRILHRSPYASDRIYDKKLASIIRAYGLDKLDNYSDYTITSLSGSFIIHKPKK